MSDSKLSSAMQEFFAEVEEVLQRINTSFSQLEKDQSNAKVIDSLYRDIHTLKGSSQLFGFKKVGQIAHTIEASLDPIRRHGVSISQSLFDCIFKAVDLIDKIFKSPNIHSGEGDEFDLEINSIIPKLMEAATNNFSADLSPVQAYVAHMDNIEIPNSNTNINSLEAVKESIVPSSLTSAATTNSVTKAEPALVINSNAISNSQTPSVSSNLNMNSSSNTKAPLETDKKSNSISYSKNMTDNNKPKKEATEETHNLANDPNSSIRVQVSLLDRLMNLVGEMVLVRNQVLQYAKSTNEFALVNLSQRLDVLTSDLQGEVMKTRMQPIGSILGKFQRVVRDIAKDLNKQIDFNVQGADTELDKSLLESIKDPLTHIIRNCCDHGIETPAERVAKGKSEVGTILVKSYHEGGQVIVEIIDNGRGLNYEKILNKAIEKNIITSDYAKNMNDKDIGLLIFAPGFSTADQVSSISGRGVGMDVVKTNIEKVGGNVEINSETDKGMTIRLKIPLTLAIVPALTVKVDGEQFAIPQVKLVELVRLEKDSDKEIEELQGKPVFRLRGQLLPLIHLDKTLGLGANHHVKTDSTNIVILNNEGEVFGLVVDEITDTADIVVKPIPNFIKKLMVYAGSTIMGDGSISMILDVAGVAQMSQLNKNTTKKELKIDSGISSKVNKAEIQEFLFFKLDAPGIYSMPLALVHRLEEFAKNNIEYSGQQKIIQYRDSILPLVSLNKLLGFHAEKNETTTENEKLPVIVYEKRGQFLGLEVNEIYDIVATTNDVQDSLKNTHGILGTIISDNNIVTVVDVSTLVDGLIKKPKKTKFNEVQTSNSVAFANDVHTEPNLTSNENVIQIKNPETKPAETPSVQIPSGVRILFAEDTNFFVKRVKNLLESHGAKVTHAADGEEAWKILNSKPSDFDMLLTDIEMPNMNGFELCEKFKNDSRFKHLPAVALTTRFREADIEKGKIAGFNLYLEKLKNEELLMGLHQVLTTRKVS